MTLFRCDNDPFCTIAHEPWILLCVVNDCCAAGFIFSTEEFAKGSAGASCKAAHIIRPLTKQEYNDIRFAQKAMYVDDGLHMQTYNDEQQTPYYDAIALLREEAEDTNNTNHALSVLASTF